MATVEGWVGIDEVASHLQVTNDSIYRWVVTKSFPAHRVGRLLRFRLSDVDEWVKTGGAGSESSSSTETVRSETSKND